MIDNDSNREASVRKEDEKGVTRYFNARGQLHRIDGPAFEDKDLQAWVQNDVIHREGGPAITSNAGSIWYRHGEKHREDGPAVEISSIMKNCYNEWWVNGEQLSQKEFELRKSKFKR